MVFAVAAGLAVPTAFHVITAPETLAGGN